MIWHSDKSRSLETFYSTLLFRCSNSSILITNRLHSLLKILRGKQNVFQELMAQLRAADFDGNVTLADGRGVPQNDSEAVRWFRLAADQGYAPAQHNLGVMYRRGDGVPENDAEAVRWYRLAAEQGLANAQHNLGYMYANGDGVPEDDVEAVRWYRLAAEQGLAEAQSNLGVMYDVGEGVPENDVRAYVWFSVAAAHGRNWACGDNYQWN
ncbi:MAG: hypothetical protein CMQ20_17535 [Gammaproteobacteria bacterium]|nr:hypothetical protein [Gammaproteobacteria bacterium]